MKKYFLGILAISFGLIAFSNAVLISCSDGTCFPSSLDFTNMGGTVSYSCDLDCGSSSSNYVSFDFVNSDGQSRASSTCYSKSLNITDDGTFTFGTEDWDPVKLVISSNNGCVGNISFQSSILPPMTVNDLSPAVTGLRATVFEIIPYVVYIGIGVLIAIIGFYAIRWLVNWMGGKLNSYFKSKRD